MLQQGHRRIAHIQGPHRYQVSLDRHQGYCDALTEEGIELDPTLVVEGDFAATGGKECACQLLTRPDLRPTAIFASSDLNGLWRFVGGGGMRTTCTRGCGSGWL
ncbi:hypothetical protein KDK_77840 [Dictyobacter kobayashii]|uniref:Transcriptional regulator LacI/GalR-like sensor domain-containing protein n=1 Tax=Dictyobacter kobayashii TaxID=2014872 RepID=A0A402AY41_9CHLR|nr:hypothetical protein KDK_77840 [Dictyobacter kobayashii]